MTTKKEDGPTPADLGLEAKTVETPPVDDDTAQTTSEAPKSRGRGRPPGSGTKSTAEKPKKSAGKKAEDIDAFAKQLQGIHVMIAMVSGVKEMAIDAQEAKMLANGINAVAEEYGLEMDGKTGAAFQLLGAAALIYGPRALAVNARVRKEKKEAAAQQQAHDEARTVDGSNLVYPFQANGNPNH